jgi:hypothetical protein
MFETGEYMLDDRCPTGMSSKTDASSSTFHPPFYLLKSVVNESTPIMTMRASSVVPLALLFNQLVDGPVKNRFEPYATQHEN